MSKSKPIILHAVESFEGGVFHSIANICHGLDQHFDFVILHGWRPKTPKDYKSYFPKRTRFIPWSVNQSLSPLSNIKSIQQLKIVTAEHLPLRVHAHSSTAGVLARLAFLNIPHFVIYSPRCFAFLRQDISKPVRSAYAMIEWLAGRTPHYIAACGYDELFHVRRMGRKTTCIPNTINSKLVDTEAEGVEKESKLTVAGSGRILPQKNFAMFAHIAELCKNENINFIWVGDGDIEAALNGKPLPENLRVTGWLSHGDSLRAMAAAHIFLHTASWEGLSRTCLEAAVLGLPLLLRPVDGARELVPESVKTGFLCESVQSFVSKIQMLASDDTLRRKLGEKARSMIEAEYNSELSNILWKEIYSNGVPVKNSLDSL